MTRRRVRATPELFEQIDRQLPAARTEELPSRHDFAAYELLKIVDRFATEWDALPWLFPNKPNYRILHVAGRVVAAVSVVGQLRVDGAIDLLEIDIDRTRLVDDDSEVDD